MKKILLFTLLCFISIATSYGQNIPPQPLSGINWDDTTVFASPKQTRFTLGWQWGSAERRVNQRFHTNMVNDKFMWTGIRNSTFPTVSDTGSPTDIGWEGFQIPPTMNQYGLGIWGFNAPALQFDPDAPQSISKTQPVREGDKTGAVLGFGYRNMRIGTLIDDTNNVNFNRYLLRKDSVSLLGADSLVLKDPVVNDQYGQGTTDVINSGRQWYISINLRRTDDLDTTTGNQPVLTIKMPFVRNDTSIAGDSIIFDGIAVSSASSGNLDTLPFGRGLALKLQNNINTNKKQFVITRDMLPRGTTGTLPRDITISASFRFRSNFDSLSSTALNDTLQGGFGNGPSVIKRLKIEVLYHGNNNIAIDWLRIETPFSRSLFRGYEDTTRFLRYVKYNIDTLLRTEINNGLNARFKNFYGADEPPEIEWRGQRYYRQLFKDRFMTEVYSNEIKYAIGYKYPWMATMPRTLQTATWPPTMPFIKFGGTDVGHLSLKRGMDSSNLFNHPYSPDGSTYETWLRWNRPGYGWTHILMGPDDISQPNYKDSLPYPDYIGGDNDGGPLAAIEGSAYALSREEVLYDGSNWWTNIQGQHEWYAGRASGQTYLGNLYRRPQTGEEIRIPMWMCILLGGKGMLYDRMFTIPLADANSITGDFSNSMTAGMMGYDTSSVTNSMTGEQLIKGKETGSDFIELNEYTNMDSYIDRAEIGTNLGVDSNRIYVGRRSTRCEIMKVHDFVHNNDTTLMKLRLVGWFGKGYGKFWSGDTSALATRLRLPELGSGTLTSPYSLTKTIWSNHEEIWDSAFVDYTILRDTNISISNTFYTGVINRRTTPFLQWPTGPGTTSLRFFTTTEFDSICTITPSWRYKQGGARTITIPFNSIDTSISAEWVVYHVEELHDGTTPPAGIKRIDTTIYQGTNLAVNFLPGEGKLFRVTVIRPEINPASGNLSHSNQRKLIAYPFVNAAGQMVRDTVRYHMTYHKARSPKPKYGTVDYGVYYKRSVPVPRQYPADMVQWEPQEYCLSDSIQTRLGIDTLDCAYPSLVVRTGADSIARVYIVYGCRDKDVVVSAQDSFVVAEHVFPANAPLITSVGTGHIIARVNAKNYRDWVTPMINASRNGNYYTWSDSLRGIGLGFKTTGSTYLADTSYISWEKSEGRTLGIAQHPSLNSYSRITLNEDDCALVWEERSMAAPPGTYMNRIYYTRLRMNADTILPYLPRGGFFVPERRVDTNSICTIANLSDRTMGASQQSFPVIYRGIEDYETLCNSDLHIGHTDKVVWQGRHDITTNQKRSISCDDNISSVPTVLFYRTVDHRDSIGGGVYLPRDWAVMPTEKIWSGISNLTQPTISQGGGVQIPSNHTNFSDSAVLINYRVTGICDSLTGLGDIWNLPMGFWTIFNKQGALGTMTNANRIVFDGQYPQLAALPGINNTNNALEWRRNRRVFEKTIEANPTILSSSQYFLRAATGQASYAFSGFAKDSVRYLITPPMIGSSYYPLNPLKESISHLVPCQGIFHGRGDYIDTITTDWVPILNGTPITYYTLGSDTAAVSLLLDRYSTNTTAILPKPVATDTAAMDATYVIAPGQTDSYRIRLIRKNTNREYLEETVLSELPLVDLLGARARAEQAYQDAKERGRSTTVIKGNLTCSLSPNPARDIIRVNIGGTIKREPVRLLISNLLGETVRVIETTTSEDTEISLVGLPSGQYMLRSALTKSEFFNPLIVSFVIER